MIHDRDGAPVEADGLPGRTERRRGIGLAADSRARASLLQGLQLSLGLIATDAPLEQSLEALVRFVEEHSGDMRCAVLLVDQPNQCLRFVAAPNVPEDYKLAIVPFLRIAPDMAPCAVAAFLRRPIYTRDTATDLAQDNAGQIAVRNGLRAIWSTPILSARGAAVGVLAMYHGHPRLPTDEHVQLIAFATQAARVALKAQAGEEMLRAAFVESPGRALVVDLKDGTMQVNRAFAELLGYQPDELAGKTLADISPDDDPTHGLPSRAGEEIIGNRRYRAKDGAALTVRERSMARRGLLNACYVVSRVERLNPAGDDPLERLSPRELQVLRLVAAGNTSKDIALRLQVSPASVDTYRSRVMNKLDLGHRGDLIRFAIDHGLTDPL